MMKRLEERAGSEYLVADGGMGTELQRRGLAPGECPELWCVERPDQVRAVYAAYREAGSQIVETNTFGGSRYKLSHYGLADRAERSIAPVWHWPAKWPPATAST